jgi:hypothetical protein
VAREALDDLAASLVRSPHGVAQVDLLLACLAPEQRLLTRVQRAKVGAGERASADGVALRPTFNGGDTMLHAVELLGGRHRHAAVREGNGGART